MDISPCNALPGMNREVYSLTVNIFIQMHVCNKDICLAQYILLLSFHCINSRDTEGAYGAEMVY